jgi:general stress protein YciG
MNDRDNAKARGRGFASMDSEKQRSIASLGGRAAHRLGTAHEFSSEEAREAGRKGGEASHRGSAKQIEQAPVQQQPSAPRVSRDYDISREQQAPQF